MKQIKLVGKAIAFLLDAVYEFCFGAIERVGKDKASAMDVAAVAARVILLVAAVFGLTGSAVVLAKVWMTWALYIAIFRTAYGMLNIITEGKCMKFNIKATFNQKRAEFKAHFADV